MGASLSDSHASICASASSAFSVPDAFLLTSIAWRWMFTSAICCAMAFISSSLGRAGSFFVSVLAEAVFFDVGLAVVFVEEDFLAAAFVPVFFALFSSGSSSSAAAVPKPSTPPSFSLSTLSRRTRSYTPVPGMLQFR